MNTKPRFTSMIERLMKQKMPAAGKQTISKIFANRMAQKRFGNEGKYQRQF